jgi:hypothetical protein
MVPKQWGKATRKYFLGFLRETHFPEFVRHGERGNPFEYPEWLIRLIGVLAVKCKEKSYVGIHRLSTHYWQELCGPEVHAPPISASQLRARLKKSALSPEAGQDTFSRYFHQRTCDNVVSADKMMVQARGPVWHRQHQEQGVIPKGLTGLDTEATWSYSKSNGWVYGHGTFCLIACKARILDAFKWMRNSANEAKRMWLETGKLKGRITTALMDSKADDKDLFSEFQRQRQVLLLTTPRKEADKSPARRRMVKVLKQSKNKRVYKQRSYTVEPMQGLIKDSFELERCWMRGTANTRWLFAAMGVVVQMHQYRAWQAGHSTWAIKPEVLGR